MEGGEKGGGGERKDKFFTKLILATFSKEWGKVV